MDKITIQTLKNMKKDGEKIVSLTAYDATFALILDDAGVEIVLVGDSLGMVLHGSKTTLNVTMADMIYHTRIVSSHCKHAMVIADMPFMSYSTLGRALGNAERLVREGGAEVVKLEGGEIVVETVNHLNNHGIPVCAHLGLTPQSIHKLGGYRMQARDKATAEMVLQDAILLEQAGASLLVLESIPAKLAGEISGKLKIPVIGIGAGPDCDGQVLVLYDILGLGKKQPRFSKNFLDGAGSVSSAVQAYVKAVKSGEFPVVEHGT